MLRRLQSLLQPGTFARGVLALGSGTVVAQAIPILVSPALTRLYSPQEMGSLALYLSLLAVLAVLATGRYELAIPLARGTVEARALLQLCLALAMISSGVAVLLVAAVLWQDPLWLGARPDLRLLLWMLPIGMLLIGLSQSLYYWANRLGCYGRMSAARMTQAAVTCGGQLAAGTIAAGAAGAAGAAALVACMVLGQAAHAGLLWWQTSKQPANLRTIQHGAWRVVLRRHGRFPAYMIPGQLANVASAQMPVILLALLVSPAVAGLYALAERVLLVPSAIVGSAVGDVYRQHAAREFHEQGQCRSLFLRTARRLLLIGLAPLAVTIAAAPTLFEFVFGSEWRAAGELAVVLAPLSFCQLVSSPLSQTVLLGQLHRVDMLWQIARLALSVGTILVGLTASDHPHLAIGLYSAAFCLLYLVHSLLQYRVAAGLAGTTAGTARKEAP
jgi:O-antigen/teichoic acid export membrane protein